MLLKVLSYSSPCWINYTKIVDSCSFMKTVAEDVVIQRIEPDPATQEFPCPHQIVQYKCQTLISTATLTWRLPSGDTLPFTGGSSVGRVRNSSDDQFSATLTGKMEDDDDHFFFTSTLLILEPINGSSLTCIASVSGSLSQRNTTIVLSGMWTSVTIVLCPYYQACRMSLHHSNNQRILQFKYVYNNYRSWLRSSGMGSGLLSSLSCYTVRSFQPHLPSIGNLGCIVP